MKLLPCFIFEHKVDVNLRIMQGTCNIATCIHVCVYKVPGSDRRLLIDFELILQALFI